MAKAKIKVSEDVSLSDNGTIITAKKGEEVEVSQQVADWEVSAGRATYADKKKEGDGPAK
ncbi:hypothetical protein [Adhaeribacter aquaticus]|uniref:hypothetical protein n=1 Tax=Adhaeribacter aquaticus TaxID=299567 RepID=UPI00041060C3|nr:hypothetical protein [Adhaeribacter aquaticus]